jgi:hypothetical protein
MAAVEGKTQAAYNRISGKMIIRFSAPAGGGEPDELCPSRKTGERRRMTIEEIRQNRRVEEYYKKGNEILGYLGFTDHGTGGVYSQDTGV